MRLLVDSEKFSGVCIKLLYNLYNIIEEMLFRSDPDGLGVCKLTLPF